MVGLSGIQMVFENRTIRHPTSFRRFEYQTSLVFRSQCTNILRQHKLSIWGDFNISAFLSVILKCQVVSIFLFLLPINLKYCPFIFSFNKWKKTRMIPQVLKQVVNLPCSFCNYFLVFFLPFCTLLSYFFSFYLSLGF